jgi:hypothetical protein
LFLLFLSLLRLSTQPSTPSAFLRIQGEASSESGELRRATSVRRAPFTPSGRCEPRTPRKSFATNVPCDRPPLGAPPPRLGCGCAGSCRRRRRNVGSSIEGRAPPQRHLGAPSRCEGGELPPQLRRLVVADRSRARACRAALPALRAARGQTLEVRKAVCKRTSVAAGARDIGRCRSPGSNPSAAAHRRP